MDDRPLILFDLDETCVYAVEREPTPGALRIGGHDVLVRPGVAELLVALRDDRRVGIWTAGTDDYAEYVAEHVFRPHCTLDLLWSRTRCTLRHDPDSPCIIG